jgi:SAM-dependent methyltransferase
MARWQRAAHLLRLPRGAAVLDVGCAFGYGTALLAARYQVAGIDPSETYIRQAQRRYPGIPFMVGTADALPYPSGRFDGAVMLDVLEHLPPGTEGRALAEIARVLRPGGVLVLSTPNRGSLASLDALNLYGRLHGPDQKLARMFALRGDPPRHRHYDARTLRSLLAAHGLVLAETRYSGVGLAELINLLLLVVLWWPTPLRPIYSVAQYLYYGAYIAEDALSLGQRSYHLMVRATRRDERAP